MGAGGNAAQSIAYVPGVKDAEVSMHRSVGGKKKKSDIMFPAHDNL